MYDRERTLALIEEARRLTSGLKIETQQIGVLIDHAFDDEEMDASAGLDEDVEVIAQIQMVVLAVGNVQPALPQQEARKAVELSRCGTISR